MANRTALWLLPARKSWQVDQAKLYFHLVRLDSLLGCNVYLDILPLALCKLAETDLTDY